MSSQPPPLPDGFQSGPYQDRQHSAGGYPAGGFRSQPYQVPKTPAPASANADSWDDGSSTDDYPSDEYPTGFGTEVMPVASPGGQYDPRTTGTYDPANDPMSAYERYSVYDDPKATGYEPQQVQSGYGGGEPTAGRRARSTAAKASATAWYREPWVLVAAAFVVGLLLGVVLF
jgi:hypothetical protein